ncbi:MAG TPA: pyrroloquinoline-quinone synthase PqqC [Candidatus Aquilonibacter sp.]|nr:pyrroloquinoline-quinone synthase PqqC [Candidatus Aquilonibacter sp.]
MKSSKRVSGNSPWPTDEFVARLRRVGTTYHDRHPFHVLMNQGKLTRRQLQGWVANRFYYQTQIPVKDAAILSNCPERELRRGWIQRITDHDGTDTDIGGIEKWLRLGEAVGLKRGELLAQSRLLPGVRYAVDAYVTFCHTQPWIIAMASSLTELFAPTLMAKRIAAFEQYYPWVKEEGLRYFRGRLTQAPRDANFALRLVVERCRTRELQEQAVAALKFKCELLWAMLDAMHFAYVLNRKK